MVKRQNLERNAICASLLATLGFFAIASFVALVVIRRRIISCEPIKEEVSGYITNGSEY